MNLNKQQREIIESGHKCIVVSAGAGTGKTRVLTERIKYLLEVKKYSHYDILALTFTRYAAQEMKKRLETAKVEIMTLHAFALHCLKQYGSSIGLHKKIDIITETERDNIIKSIAEDSGLKIKRDFKYSEMIWDMNSIKPEYKIIILNYWQILKKYELMDYDKLIFAFNELLDKDESARNKLRNRYLHILIDEFQDTNNHLWGIIQKINPKNLFIVGDVDQSLYAWNGAEPYIMIELSQNSNWQLYKLERNYRCPIDVITAVNSLILKNEKRIERELFTKNEREGLLVTNC